MANTTWTKPGLWTELDALGEDMVKERLRMDFYGAPGMVGSKRALVEEWLLSKEVSRREALHARQAEAASQAVEAASRAAIAVERQAAVAEYKGHDRTDNRSHFSCRSDCVDHHKPPETERTAGGVTSTGKSI